MVRLWTFALVSLLTLAAAAVALGAGSGTPAVPGLRGYTPSLPGSKGAPPTVGQCATAWNAHATAATRKWVATQKPKGVYISVGPSASDAKSPAPFCQVRFPLSGSQSLGAQAPWKKTDAGPWQGEVQVMMGPLFTGFVKHLNGSVKADGTIHCFARCNAK